MTDPQLIYKIAARSAYEAALPTGRFEGTPVDFKDGYIHFSTAGQLAETLARHYAGQDDLTLIAVRLADIAADVKWEASRGGALFPHLYGVLPLSSVAWTAPIAVAADGSADLPEGVR